MTTVLIVYASTYGNTKKLAGQVAEGVRSVTGVTAILKEADTVTGTDCLDADAIIVGSPVHMGSPDWRVKKFIDDITSGLWMKDKLIGKVAGVFCTGAGFGNAGGGCELTMLGLLNNFAELGMLIVPLPKNTPNYPLGGLQWGPYGRSATQEMQNVPISDEVARVGFYHGANIARVAKELKGKQLFTNK
jgi:NAD(P)H dehydrogenase (quinone)